MSQVKYDSIVDVSMLGVEVEEKYQEFEKEISDLINKHSMEVFSNTPDYILAEYMTDCLRAFTRALIKKNEWEN